jgi:hypothetical protein
MAYADRRNTLTKKQLAQFGKFANRPRAESSERTEERKRLWTDLNDFVNQQHDGSRITSVPGTSPVQLEVLPDSDLPDKLMKAGFELIFRSEETRLGGAVAPEYQARWRRGVRSGGYGFYTVSVFDIRLPTK